MPSRELVISANRHETTAAILEDDQLVEIFFQRANEYSLAGSIHKGRVTRVLPGMQSAFVDLGLDRDTFLYVSDFFDENGEEFETLSGPPDEKPVARVTVVETAPPPVAPPESPVEAPSAERAPDAEGRDRRGRRSRRRRNRGRGFPEEKYADPKEQRPEEEEAKEEPQAIAEDSEDFPILLPGESLAKYRERPSEDEDPELTFEPLFDEQDEEGVEIDLEPLGGVFDLASDEAEEELELDEPESAVEAEEEPVKMTAEGVAEAEVEEPAAEEPADEPPATETKSGRSRGERGGRRERGRRTRAVGRNALSLANVPPKGSRTEPEDEVIVDNETKAVGTEPEQAGHPEQEEESAAQVTSVPDRKTQTPASGSTPEAAVASPSGGENERDEEDDEEDSTPKAAANGDAEEGDDPAQAGPLSARVRGDGDRYAHVRIQRRSRRRRVRGPDETQPPGDRPAASAEPPVAAAPVAAPPKERTEPKADARTAKPDRIQTPSITELLKEGQEILVQIAKEPLGQKGARITSHIALPGRYVVYMPTVEHLGVSRKIGSDEERQRLRRILQKHRQGMPGGFIMRTAGEGRKEEEIEADMKYLFNMWLDIRQRAEKRRAPALIYHDVEVVQRILRDHLTESFKAIWVDNEEIYADVLSNVQRFQPDLVGRIKLYTRKAPIYDAFGITSELEKALRPKVWLKSGGYIVINQTEALVAIDINTGKFVGRSNRLEDTIVKTNIEAVKEIVRQIRLRDLGGIIVVDFIDMEERKNRQRVMQALEEAMRADRAPFKILQFNDFGLVAITRKRVKQSLERTLCMPCPHCEGAGYVKSVQTVISEIILEAKKLRSGIEDKQAVLRVNPDVAKELKSTKNTYLEEIEETLGVPVMVTGDPELHHEKFDLS